MLSICFFNFKLDHEIINASEGKLICHIARIKKVQCTAVAAAARHTSSKNKQRKKMRQRPQTVPVASCDPLGAHTAKHHHINDS